ncbi:MAG TPA: collagen-binding domain-containing protein [Verrucomicrobiae bacterium]|nr:collagen-binding domain-containing protein [Verrucomicrobiae bacterium]
MKGKVNVRNVVGSALKLASAVCLCQVVAAKAQSVDLGAAGDFAILETGAGALNANVSLAAAPPNGLINGNIGLAGSGNLSDSGVPINGNVYLGAGAGSSGLSGNVSGSVSQNFDFSAAISAAVNAEAQAAALSASGGGAGYSTIDERNNVTLNLTPGVYDLSDFELKNGDIVNLAAGGSYVFNISGTLSLNSAEILAAEGLSDSDILFNVEGSHGVSFSGGLHHESVLDGTILAENASVSVTPGEVNGEIISGENINIASGGSVNSGGPASSVPETAPTWLLLALGMVAILAPATKARSGISKLNAV